MFKYHSRDGSIGRTVVMLKYPDVLVRQGLVQHNSSVLAYSNMIHPIDPLIIRHPGKDMYKNYQSRPYKNLHA